MGWDEMMKRTSMGCPIAKPELHVPTSSSLNSTAASALLHTQKNGGSQCFELGFDTGEERS